MNKQFKYFDVMNKGKVNFDQFSRAIEKIGVVMNEFDLKLVFNKYDLSGDGELDFKEFGMIFSQNEGGDLADNSGSRNNDPYIQEKNRQNLANAELRHDSP